MVKFRKKIFIYAWSWDPDRLFVSIDETTQESLIYLGERMIELDTDIIPDKETFNAMVSKHAIRMANMNVVECEVNLNRAKEVVKSMIALEHSE